MSQNYIAIEWSRRRNYVVKTYNSDPYRFMWFENLEGQRQDGPGYRQLNTPYGPLHGRQEPTDGKRPIPCLNFWPRVPTTNALCSSCHLLDTYIHIERRPGLYSLNATIFDRHERNFGMTNRLSNRSYLTWIMIWKFYNSFPLFSSVRFILFSQCCATCETYSRLKLYSRDRSKRSACIIL